MFYYLSFLRPPPQQSLPSNTISITPQVANDLRTELHEDSRDIFYSWSMVSRPDASTSNAIPVTTKPQKLTTWRLGDAYREISVPMPPGIKDGQSWRLFLTVYDQGNPHIINLGGSTCGSRPFPVMSMPILFASCGKTGHIAAGKQEQVERIYRILNSTGDQLFLKVMEQTSFDLDKKVWDSGIGLSSWLVSLASHDSDINEGGCWMNGLKSALLSRNPCNIVELGAGTGIVSLTLGALRSPFGESSNAGCIITTDLDSAMPLLDHNISLNDALFSSGSVRPQPVVLDWEETQLPIQIQNVHGGFDVVLMADVTYNTSSFPDLIRTLKDIVNLHDPSMKPHPHWILLGYKERDPAERTLWDMAHNAGIDFQRVGERKGAGGTPVEIWIGRLHQG